MLSVNEMLGFTRVLEAGFWMNREGPFLRVLFIYAVQPNLRYIGGISESRLLMPDALSVGASILPVCFFLLWLPTPTKIYRRFIPCRVLHQTGLKIEELRVKSARFHQLLVLTLLYYFAIV